MSLQQVWEFNEFFSSFIRGRDMYYVVSQFVKPLTSHIQTSYAELAGASEVEWFVSHFWGNKFAQLLETLQKHAHEISVQTAPTAEEDATTHGDFLRRSCSMRHLQGNY